jgi:hypothetical protein
VATFRAIELDRTSRKPTGRRHTLDGRGRDEAIAALLGVLGVAPESARVDPSRTLVDLGGSLWTLVNTSAGQAGQSEPPALRRAAAKHRRVR